MKNSFYPKVALLAARPVNTIRHMAWQVSALLALTIASISTMNAQSSLAHEFISGGTDGFNYIIGEANNNLYMVAYGTSDTDEELFKMDASGNVTQVTNDFPAYTGSVVMRNFYVDGNYIYFSSRRGGSSLSFTRFNTTTNTIDIYDNTLGDPDDWFTHNGMVYFISSKSGVGRQLWKIDPATGVITQVTTANAPSGIMSSSGYQTIVGNTLYTSGYLSNYPCGSFTCIDNHEFIAVNLTTGAVTSFDLFTGSPSGASYSNSSAPKHFYEHNGKIYFAATNPVSGSNHRQLFVYDPVSGAAPTRLTSFTHNHSGDDGVADLMGIGDKIYFRTEVSTPRIGEMYVYNITSGTSTKLTNFNVAYSSPSAFMIYGGMVHFLAYDGTDTDIFKINPTNDNITRVGLTDLYWGSLYDTIWDGDKLYWGAESNTAGSELLLYDRSTETLSVAADIVNGSGDSWAGGLYRFNGDIYFGAYTAAKGFELYKYELGGSTPPAPNQAPVFVDTTLSIAENSSNNTVVGAFGATDANSDPLTYTIISGNTGSAFKVSGTNLAVNNGGQLNYEQTSSYTLQVSVSDGTDADTATITVNITDVNEAPVITGNTTHVIPENVAVNYNGSSVSASDPEGQALSYSIISGNTNNAWKIDNTGQIKVNNAAAMNYEVQHLWFLTVQISDGVNTITTPVRGEIYDLNEAPYIDVDTFYVSENAPNGTTVGQAVAHDPEGGAVYFYAITGPFSIQSNGIIKVDNTTYNGPIDYEAASMHKPYVYVRDAWPNPTMDNTKIVIMITDANDAPTLSNTVAATDEDQALNLAAPIGLNIYADQDGDTMRAFKILSLPASGHLEIHGNPNVSANTEYTFNDFIGLTYVPAANESGTVSLSINLSDGTAYAASPATLTINVNAVNDAPIITDVQAVHEEDVANGMLTGFTPGVYSDVEGDTAQWFKVVSLPVNGSLSFNGQPINAGDVLSLADAINAIYTPAQDYFGPDSYTFNISDGTDYADNDATVYITVNPVSDAPTDISLTNTSLDENMPAGTVIGTLSAADIDPADSHTFQVSSAAGTFSVNGSQLVSNTVFNHEIQTAVTVDVTAIDLAGETFTKTFNITINDANDAPTAIQLSNNTISETTTVNSFVGILSASDEDAVYTHTYSLVSGNGDTDNGAFVINNNILQTNTTFNYNTQQAYSIRVRVTDNGGAIFEETFVINITDDNTAPTDMTLSANVVLENEASGTLVGSIATTDADQAETFTYMLINGVGATDNASFSITDDKLYTAASFDFETKSTYSIRVRVEDGAGNSYAEVFTIQVQDVNEAPTLLSLSNNTVAENLPAGTAVGGLVTTDVDAQDSHTYSLVTGAGSSGNSAFSIQGSQLVTNTSFDYEAQDTYSIRVKTVDGAGHSIEDVFTINIADGNDAPVGVTLDVLSIDENSPMGATIGTLTAVDPDSAGQHTFTLVSGPGADDNASFTIVANKLQVNHSYDYETKNSYLVRVRATDQLGDWTEESFAIDINDVNEAPTSVSAQTLTISENMPAGTVVAYLNTADEDNGDSHNYALVTGTGDADNNWFTINGNEVVTAAELNFESQSVYSIRIESADLGGLKKTTVAQINIVDANDTPVALDMQKTTSANTSVSIYSRELLSTWSDEDGDAIATIRIQSVPGNGTLYHKTTPLQVGDVISLSDIAYLKYVPTQNFAGNDNFTYQVSDGVAYGNVATVNITVNMGRVAGPRVNAGNGNATLNGLIFNREAGPETGIDELNAEHATLGNYPNPFQGSTHISYQLPGEYIVSIKVYDLLGKEVHVLVNDLQPAGEHTIVWNGTDKSGQELASGKYICQMILTDGAGTHVAAKTISLMKVK